MTVPESGWTTEGVVTRVVDGDTLDITVTRTLRVRLLDCWAPESKSDPRVAEDQREREKAAGIASKNNLIKLASGASVRLHIPTDGSGVVARVSTMGRVLGTVWVAGSDKSLNELQVSSGHATKTKRDELK